MVKKLYENRNKDIDTTTEHIEHGKVDKSLSQSIYIYIYIFIIIYIYNYVYLHICIQCVTKVFVRDLSFICKKTKISIIMKLMVYYFYIF